MTRRSSAPKKPPIVLITASVRTSTPLESSGITMSLRASQVVIACAGKRATVEDALAPSAVSPPAIIAGRVRKDPPPASTLMNPAAKPAAR